jgi:hypothetical protein
VLLEVQHDRGDEPGGVLVSRHAFKLRADRAEPAADALTLSCGGRAGTMPCAARVGKAVERPAGPAWYPRPPSSAQASAGFPARTELDAVGTARPHRVANFPYLARGPEAAQIEARGPTSEETMVYSSVSIKLLAHLFNSDK